MIKIHNFSSNKFENHLKCPMCLYSLTKRGQTLICPKNKHRFRVEQGIPILLDYSSLSLHSQKQQAYFEKNIRKPKINLLKKMDNWKIQYLERFVENFKKTNNKLVIEIGTGSGYMAIGLAKLGANVIACDITLKNLINLKRFAKILGIEKNLFFVCCSADRLPFKNNTCDYYVLNSVLEHIQRESKAISEIRRVLKKSGGLMITVPIKYKYIFPLLLPVNILHDIRIGHLRRYDDTSLNNKFKDFSLRKIYFTGHLEKVIKVMINMIIKVFDEKAIEDEDQKKNNIKLWSSNLIAFLHKK